MLRETAQPYKALNKYPGMGPNDAAIWETFIMEHPGQFFHVWYNVHIGDPVGEDHDHDEMKDNGMFDVSCWCIDVLAEDENGFWVIEIKPNALAGALGQALAYTELIKREHEFDKVIRPAVLTDDIAPITQQAAALLGVALLTP